MTGLREYIRDQNKKAVQIAIGMYIIWPIHGHWFVSCMYPYIVIIVCLVMSSLITKHQNNFFVKYVDYLCITFIKTILS